MSKRKLAALLLGSCLIPLASQPAAAVDYIFTVNVDVRSLHPTVTTGQVTCGLLDARGTGVSVISPGRTNFTLAGGSFAGAVEVRMSTPRGAAAAVTWRCHLYFEPPDLRGNFRLAESLSTPTHPEFREEFRRADGSVFRGLVEGRF